MSNIQNRPKPVVLCILDGWGHREDAPDNAITQANTPFLDELVKNNPHSLLETSGLAVGLPEGQMGNSEVGHMNIGSGRVIMQSLPKIDLAIENGSLAKDPELAKFIEGIKKSGGVCHLLGLLSPGGVHSHQSHMSALAKIVADAGISVKVHAFLDGRDVPPASTIEYLKKFRSDVKGYDVEIVTAAGRYYAMDRDNRWDRVELAYDAMVSGIGSSVSLFESAIEAGYKENVFDEFVKPMVVPGYSGMNDGDGVLMANFRADRARQILTALVDPEFSGFARKKLVSFSGLLGAVEYSEQLNKFVGSIYKSDDLSGILGEIIANNGLAQFKIAETEKYAHVTFFFNGGREEKFEREDRILVPSPKVATYDELPEMSAFKVTDELVSAIKSDKYDLLVVNYANTDMVGHTGVQLAAMQAVEAIDKSLKRVVEAINEKGGVILITADHGNSEQMCDGDSGQPHTAHTTNPVPLIFAGKIASNYCLNDGRLCDIAPSILEIMGLPQPSEMTGKSLLKRII
ncbi:MAG: Phosphoglyceromutase [Rickettsiaceae bacterium]|jgi:2,3-bisphosphoglycerate-independent phosphoglycerate mutase|nr:Phosphoglyceromutase [Rickettsiaceae bacterium]